MWKKQPKTVSNMVKKLSQLKAVSSLYRKLTSYPQLKIEIKKIILLNVRELEVVHIFTLLILIIIFYI